MAARAASRRSGGRSTTKARSVGVMFPKSSAFTGTIPSRACRQRGHRALVHRRIFSLSAGSFKINDLQGKNERFLILSAPVDANNLQDDFCDMLKINRLRISLFLIYHWDKFITH
jgi:hypothetical protein